MNLKFLLIQLEFLREKKKKNYWVSHKIKTCQEVSYRYHFEMSCFVVDT